MDVATCLSGRGSLEPRQPWSPTWAHSVAKSFQDLCGFYDTVLPHLPVEAPWRNGVAASTKAVLQRLVKEYLPVTETDVAQVVAADSGYSPSQAVFGRQPEELR